MKVGRSINELAAEIVRRAKAKRDFVAPASKMSVGVGEEGKIHLTLDAEQRKKYLGFPLNKVAHEQLADYLGIPMQYYRRMLEEAPELVAANANRWLKGKADDKDRRMVRTIDGNVRALLSDKYRPLEHEDLAEAIMPVLSKRNLMIVSCEITDQRLYIKAVDKGLEAKVRLAGKRLGEGHDIFDHVFPAVNISNSEVGRGSLLVEAGTYTGGCTNLCFFGASMRKFHTGARADLSEDVIAVLSDRTKKLTDAAVWAQVNDIISAAFDPKQFGVLKDRLEEAGTQRMAKDADVVQVIERFGKKLGISEGEQKGVLQHLIQGGDLSKYGVHSAITRYAQDVDDYDRATDLEKAGARVIELPRNEWISLAA